MTVFPMSNVPVTPFAHSVVPCQVDLKARSELLSVRQQKELVETRVLYSHLEEGVQQLPGGVVVGDEIAEAALPEVLALADALVEGESLG